MKSHKVSIWNLSFNKTTKRLSYLVRWVVDGHRFGESYKTEAWRTASGPSWSVRPTRASLLTRSRAFWTLCRARRRRCPFWTWPWNMWMHGGLRLRRSSGTA